MCRITLVVAVSFLLPFLAAAETAPIQLERAGVYPAGRVTAVDAQGSFVVWGFGRNLHFGRLRSDGTIAETGSLLLENSISRVALAGSTAVAATFDGALAFVDLADPSAPVLQHWVSRVAPSTRDLVTTSDHIFVASWDAITVRRLDTGRHPWRSPAWRGDRRVNAIALDGDLMMACDSSAVHTFDVSDPADFEHLAAIPGALNEAPGAIGIRDGLAVVACGDGLRIFDVGDPASPIEIGHVDTSAVFTDAAMLDDLALLAGSYELSTVDLHDPANPTVIPAAGVPSRDFAASAHGVLAVVDEGLVVVAAVSHGDATIVNAVDAPPTGPVRALELLGDGTVVASAPGPAVGTLRALRTTGDGLLVEWVRTTPPIRAGGDLMRAGDDLLILDDNGRLALYRIGGTGFELESVYGEDPWLAPLAATDDILWAASGPFNRQLLAISIADPQQPQVLSTLWVGGPGGSYGGPRTTLARSEPGVRAGGGAVWSSATSESVALWLDWTLYDDQWYSGVTSYRHQVRLIDATSPEAPAEVGLHDAGGRYQLVARHGDRLVIGQLATGGYSLRALSIADPAHPAVVAEGEVDRLPTDAQPFSSWLLGRVRTSGQPIVLIDPGTLELSEITVVPESAVGIRLHAVSWPWLALVRTDGAVELYRATEDPSP